MAEYTYTYPSVLESEDKFLDDLARIVAAEDLDEHLANGFLLTVSEAFTNALVHGNGLDPGKLVTVVVRGTEDGIAADVTDEGRAGIDSIRHRRPAGRLADHGRGIKLMEYYAGRLDFSETPSGGLKVSLAFDRKRERIGQ